MVFDLLSFALRLWMSDVRWRQLRGMYSSTSLQGSAFTAADKGAERSFPSGITISEASVSFAANTNRFTRK